MSSENAPGGNNAYTIYIPVGVFTVVCPLLVVTRFWSRLRNGGRLGADDYTILASLIFALASSGIMVAACYYGYGQHIANLSRKNNVEAMEYFYLCQITYKASINLTKTSILLLYLRIFSNVRWFRYVCIFMATAVAMYCIASVVTTIFQCNPIRKAFDKDNVSGTCIDNGHFWFANAGFSIATDIVILLLPMPLVYALQLPRLQKAALMIVFTLGAFVVITSCLRITTIDIQATTRDPTYDIQSTMWTIIEMNVAIVCACLPQIRPCLVKLFPKIMPASLVKESGSSGGVGRKIIYGSNALTKPSQRSYTTSHPSPTSRVSDQDTIQGGRWARMEGGQESYHMTNIGQGTPRKGETSSEEYILQEDRDKSMRIEKTVGYSVEYSQDGIHPA